MPGRNSPVGRNHSHGGAHRGIRHPRQACAPRRFVVRISETCFRVVDEEASSWIAGSPASGRIMSQVGFPLCKSKTRSVRVRNAPVAAGYSKHYRSEGNAKAAIEGNGHACFGTIDLA